MDSSPQRRTEIIANSSYSEEEKLGAVASLVQIVSRIGDSCLIIAGDNLFTSSLKPMILAFKDKSCALVALYDVKDLQLAKQYSTTTVDRDGRIIKFTEKPSKPDTTLLGTCIYVFPKGTLNKMKEYLTEAADRDNTGRFIGWLCRPSQCTVTSLTATGGTSAQ